MSNEKIYETTEYQVNVLEEPISVEQDGALGYLNYEVVNKGTGRTEGLLQFQPYAMDLAISLTEALNDLNLRAEVDLDGNTNVVTLN